MTSLAPLSALDSISSSGSMAADAGSAVASAASAVSTSAQKFIFGGLTLSQVIIILLGLMLIGAGLFSMQGTRAIILKTGKAAATAAASA